ncbi:hypothetical protein JTB14_035258 [Gonioctena quinquepunctata]|nr:hypothetical protein JTB14_035258 [Gonioctena quinquepunctata]
MHNLSALLLTLLFVIQISTCSCSSNCCDSSSCQTSSCHSHTCCSCYRICDSGCRTSSCADQCRQRSCRNEECRENNDCGENKDCCKSEDRCKNEDCGEITPSTYQTTPTTSTNHPGTPESVVENGEHSSYNTNNGTLEARISITNKITNVERVYVPINITNNNLQSIQIIPAFPVTPVSPVSPVTTVWPTKPATTSEATGIETDSTTSLKPPRTPCSTELVPVPVPIYRPIPYPVRVPYVIPVSGCCNVITPCINGQTCNPFQSQCGSQCTNRDMFTAMNPCVHGCYRRRFAPRRSCFSSGYCSMNMIDCDTCSDDFYTSYSGYQQCGGCFYTMNDYRGGYQRL